MIRPFILSRFSCGYALALVLVFVTTAANGQITVGGGKTILSGQINIGADIPSVEASAFSCVTVKTFKKGEKIVGIFQIDQSGQNKIWSSSKHSFYIGSAKIVYPIAAIVPTPDKIGHTIFAANLKAKTSMKAGDKLSIDGYEIEASRPVASGESIPVLFVIGNENIALLSIETTQSKPLLAVFKANIDSRDRVSAIDAWQLEKNYAEHTK